MPFCSFNLPQITLNPSHITLNLPQITLHLLNITLHLRQITLHPPQIMLHLPQITLTLAQVTLSLPRSKPAQSHIDNQLGDYGRCTLFCSSFLLGFYLLLSLLFSKNMLQVLALFFACQCNKCSEHKL